MVTDFSAEPRPPPQTPDVFELNGSTIGTIHWRRLQEGIKCLQITEMAEAWSHEEGR